MKIKNHTVFVGPNVFARDPVVRFVLESTDERALSEVDIALIDSFYQRLTQPFPQVECPAATSAVKSAEMLPWHLFEHLCIQLQNLAGTELACTRGRDGSAIDASVAVVPYEDDRVCIEAGRLAEAMMNELLSLDATQTSGRFEELEGRITGLTKLAARKLLPVQDRALVTSARARDVPVARLAGRIIQLGQGRYQQRLGGTKTSMTNVVSNDLAANKDYARRILGDLGLPIPRYIRVNSRRAAADGAEQLGYPVVVKPNKGNMGRGVSVGMKNRKEVRAAYDRAREFGRSVLVEELVEGFDYRMLVINGELCAASKRVPGHVRGDGAHTVEELVAETNKDSRRGDGQKHSWTRIKLDAQADRLLGELNYTRQSVPAEGEIVYLRRNANTSDGGTAVDVTDQVHPDNRDIAVRTAKAIGLDIAGVDLLTADISKSMWKSGGSICEVNSKPGLRKHMWPAEGKPRDVTTPIVEMLFPPGRRSRIPVVAVTGTPAYAAVAARMLARILESCGRHVGLAVEQRALVGGRPVRSSPLSGVQATRTILLDPDVDIAIMEVDLGDVLQHGLGCDVFDLCAIVMPSQDRSGQSLPSDLTRALQVCLSITRETVLVDGARDVIGSLVDDTGVEVVQISPSGEGSPVLAQLLGSGSEATSHAARFANAMGRLLGAESQDIDRSLRSFRSPTSCPGTQSGCSTLILQ